MDKLKSLFLENLSPEVALNIESMLLNENRVNNTIKN